MATFGLVHGAWCWTLIPELRSRGHTAIPLAPAADQLAAAFVEYAHPALQAETLAPVARGALKATQ